MSNRHNYIFFVILLLVGNAFAKTMGDPGEGGGNGNEIGPYSGTVLSGGGYLNPLTGLPVYSVKVLRMLSNSGYNVDVDFQYGANIRSEVTKDNELSPTGWCGLGWHTGFSTIWVVHQNTLKNDDDKYYYRYSNGVVSEIVKTTDGRYRIKNDPFWLVTPHANTVNVLVNILPPRYQNFEIIDKWTIRKTDGSVFVYGNGGTGGQSNACRKVPAFGVKIGIPLLFFPDPVDFYYQWDLSYAEDVNGSRIRFDYQQTERYILRDLSTTHHNYTGESYVSQVAVDNGDKIIFDVEDKNANEMPSSVITHDAVDFRETHFLRSIRFLDMTNREIDKIILTYSGDAGQLPHLYSGTAGYEKRVLVGIASTKTAGNINRIFNYDRGTSYCGLLTRISEPVTGKTIDFNYSLQSIFYSENNVQLERRFPVITQIKTFDGVKAAPASVTAYTYPTDPLKQRYIPGSGIGFWGEVKANSGTGDVITMYEINPANHLFGSPLSVSIYDKSGKLKSNQANVVESYKFNMNDQDFTNLPGNTITSRGEIAPNNTDEKAFDNKSSTKWVDAALDVTTRASWINIKFANNSYYLITGYNLTSANDAPACDPYNWTLEGSNDGADWHVVDSRSAVTWSDRNQQQAFTVSIPMMFSQYRLVVARVRDPGNASAIQLAEIELTGPNDWFYKVVTKSENTIDGIKTISGMPICALNAENGLSSLTYNTNSDGKAIVSKTGFAFEFYPEMSMAQGSGQILSAASTILYEIPGYRANCDLSGASVVSATFTTWVSQNGYRPHKMYVWKASAPVPITDFASFNINNQIANGWQLNGTIEKYNCFGSVLDASGPTGNHAATIYRSDYNLPIAKIANARYLECAAFTCDYDMDQDGYYDKNNGWEKSGSILSTAKTHYSNKSVYVDLPVGSNLLGPTRNVAVFPGKDYIMSAWALVESGTLEIYGDYRYRGENEDAPLLVGAGQKSFSVPSAKATASPNWQYIQLVIPASQDLTPADWSSNSRWAVRMYVGSPNGVKAYIDDIRFYPTDALMNTTNYDMTWRMARQGVDANNKPSQLSEFDNFGRLISTYKIDKTKGAQDAGYKKITMSKEYHLMGDDVRVLSPNGGEVLRAGSPYAITWWTGSGSVGDQGVDISFYDGSSWTNIASGITGRNAYVWNIPTGAAKSGCRIKVASLNYSSKWDQSKNTFSIVTNSAPPAPMLTAPINYSEIANNNPMLTWSPSIDPDAGDIVSYKVEIKRANDPWTTIVDNIGNTQYPVSLPVYGLYSWRITASDGQLSNSTVCNFYYVPADFFIIRDIANKMVYSLSNDIYDAIYNSLSSEKKTKFSSTYSNTTSISGRHAFKDAIYFQQDDFGAGNNFYYSIWHLKNNDWIQPAVFEGNGIGYTDLCGGGGCGLWDGEARNLIICPNYQVVSNPPALSITFDHACLNVGSSTYSWNEAPKTAGNGDNAIMRLKLSITNAGYHTWYQAEHRGPSSNPWCNSEASGWKHDGEWTGDGQHKLDKIFIYMFKYN